MSRKLKKRGFPPQGKASTEKNQENHLGQGRRGYQIWKQSETLESSFHL